MDYDSRRITKYPNNHKTFSILNIIYIKNKCASKFLQNRSFIGNDLEPWLEFTIDSVDLQIIDNASLNKKRIDCI